MRKGSVILFIILGLFVTALAFVISYLYFRSSPIELVRETLSNRDVIWSSNVKRFTQLSVSGDTLYALSSDGYIYAMDPNNSKGKWNIKINGSIESNFHLYKDYIYYVSSLSDKPTPTSSRTLYAVNNKTGQEVWRREIQFYVTNLNVIDDVLYYTSYKEQKLFALNSLTGELLWSFDINVSASGGSRPEAANGITLIGVSPPDNQSPNGSKLYALDSTSGKAVWTFPASRYTDAASAPLLIANGTVYLSLTDYEPTIDVNFLFALDLKTGEVRWKTKIENGSGGSLATTKNKIFLSQSYRYVYAFDEATGKELWRIKVKDGENGVLSFRDSLYSVNNQDGAELAPYYGNLSAIDVNTGKTNWQFTKHGTTFSNIKFLDDTVFVLSTKDGKIYALR